MKPMLSLIGIIVTALALIGCVQAIVLSKPLDTGFTITVFIIVEILFILLRFIK